MKLSNRIILPCDCSTHSLQIDRINEWKCFEISVWHLGHCSRPLTWKERIRWIWRILTTGNPWADSVILKDSDMLKISKFTNKQFTKK